MNILDENISRNQKYGLNKRKIRFRQIGYEISNRGIKDEEIIPFLHKLGTVTFFTRDLRFYQSHLCHSQYCLVILAVADIEIASFIHRFLRHPEFNTKAKRMGKIVRVSHSVIRMWKLNDDKEYELLWR
jgi:hypothetical protein